MKKVSVISMLSVLVLPAFAHPDVIYLYGDTDNIKLLEMSKLNALQTPEQQPLVQPEVKQPIASKEAIEQKVAESKVIEQNVEEKLEEKKSEKSQEKKTTKKKNKKQQNEEQKTEEQQPEEQPIEPQKTEVQKFEPKTTSNPKARFPHGLQLGAGVSATSGLNAFVGYNNKNFDSFWWKRFGVRIDFATYSPVKNSLNRGVNDIVDDKGIKVDDGLKINNVDINAKHIGALVDFYPFGDTWFLGGLRVSGGYMSGNIDVGADIFGTKESGGIEFELGDRKYRYDGNEMHGKSSLNWKYKGPYLGAGFDLGLFAGFKLYLDAGVVFTDNNAKINLDVPITSDLKDITSGTPQEITGEYKAKFEEAKAKTTQEAQDELDKLDYYPIVKLGFMYRF